jgi:hypothetical protein
MKNKLAKWYIKPNNVEEARIVGKWFDENWGNPPPHYNFYEKKARSQVYYVYGMSPGNVYFLTNRLIKESYTEITFDYFIKNILIQEEMKNKKLIGYEVPINMFKNEIKKGDIYAIYKDNDLLCTPLNYGKLEQDAAYYSIPKEIVETWNPVYEETLSSKVFTLAYKGFTLEIFKDGNIITEEGNFNIQEIKDLHHCASGQEIELKYVLNGAEKKWKVFFDTMSLGCTFPQIQVTKDELSEIIRIYNELQK